MKGGESDFTFDKDFGLRCSTLRRIHGGVSTENQKKLLAFLLLAIGPVSKDSTEGTESSTKASYIDIVDVVVVIGVGVAVGISDEGNSYWRSVQWEGENERKRKKKKTFLPSIKESCGW